MDGSVCWTAKPNLLRGTAARAHQTLNRITMPSSEHGFPIVLIECGLTAICVGLSFIFPWLGASWFAQIERSFARLARKKGLALVSIGLSAFLLRIAILPLFPAPQPTDPNDFSFLLAADTFAHGHLTNPTPAMWTHFESIFISMTPTYMSMFFPGYGLILAAGQVLFGNPWFANVFVDALMCSAVCWMLQAWLPPRWALLGGCLAILRIGLFSNWINTISAGSALLTALGGALVLGALPRLMKTVRLRYGLLMAIGIAILALTRPYEGLFLCFPVLVALCYWAWRGKNRPTLDVLLRQAAIPLVLLVASLAWLGYYDYCAFGSPTTLPYTLNQAQYAMKPYFLWQAARPEPHYRHALMRRFYESELQGFTRIHSLSGCISLTLVKPLVAILLFAGFALLPPLIMTRRVLLDRRVRLLVLCMFVLMAGLAVEILLTPYYLGLATALFYALGLQAMRHLRVWSPNGAPVGKTMVRFSILLCLVMALVTLLAAAPPEDAFGQSFRSLTELHATPNQFSTERAKVQFFLDKLPGKQLVLVRYSPDHNPIDQWVYNRADINDSKIIWAWDMGPTSNQELLDYYKDRKAWLVEPDAKPVKLTPYPEPAPKVASPLTRPRSGS